MGMYLVYGTVAGIPVNKVVEAYTGADAIKDAVKPYYPQFGRDFIRQRREWFREHVRLNARQLVQ